MDAGLKGGDPAAEILRGGMAVIIGDILPEPTLDIFIKSANADVVNRYLRPRRSRYGTKLNSTAPELLQ
jgi:hypothetical protein